MFPVSTMKPSEKGLPKFSDNISQQSALVVVENNKNPHKIDRPCSTTSWTSIAFFNGTEKQRDGSRPILKLPRGRLKTAPTEYRKQYSATYTPGLDLAEN